MNGKQSSSIHQQQQQQQQLLLFDAIYSQQFDQVLQIAPHSSLEISKCIPLLTRIYLNSFEQQTKQKLYKILQSYHETSICIEYESIDWPQLINAIHNEMTVREKSIQETIDDSTTLSFAKFCESSLVYSLGEQLITEFENGTYERRARLLLSELGCLIQYYNYRRRKNSNYYPDSTHFSLELLLANDLYQKETDFIISIVFNRSQLFTTEDLTRVLYSSEYAQEHVTSFVANNPNEANKV
jgi:hypothetical protein